MKFRLNTRSNRGRTGPARGLYSTTFSTVSRSGGRGRAGLISGASVITRGEAFGHEMFVDREFVGQVAAAMAAAGDRGVKSRFTHPDMSNDGLGKYLGRFRSPKTVDDGDRAIGSLHLSRAARKAPDGDLARYVLDLAADDPAAFGTSIVFMHDREAEAQFVEAHGGKATRFDDGFVEFDLREFKSPDALNDKNHFHARLAALRAVDVVDDPAANPNGLFGADPIFDDAEALACFAAGLAEVPPDLAALDVEPRKVQFFVSKFLDRHNLELRRKGESMNDGNQQGQTGDQGNQAGGQAAIGEQSTNAAGASSASSAGGQAAGDQGGQAAAKPAGGNQAATLDKLRDACPGADAEFLIEQLERGATVRDAQSAYIADRNQTIEQLTAQADHLAGSETAAADFGAEGGSTAPPRRDRDAGLKSMIRFAGNASAN